MTLAAIKEKLHEYIDHADSKKAHALFTLLENEITEPEYFFDEETLNMLDKEVEDILSGRTKTYTLAESMEHINEYRRRNGI